MISRSVFFFLPSSAAPNFLARVNLTSRSLGGAAIINYKDIGFDDSISLLRKKKPYVVLFPAGVRFPFIREAGSSKPCIGKSTLSLSTTREEEPFDTS